MNYEDLDEEQIKKKVRELKQCGCLRCVRQIKDIINEWNDYKEIKNTETKDHL